MIGRYGLLAVEVGVGDVGVGVEAPGVVGVGVGVGQGRPSSAFRHPAGELGDGLGAGGVEGDVAGLTAGGAVVDIDVSGAGAGLGPLRPP